MKFLVLFLSLTMLQSAFGQLGPVTSGDAIQADKINSMITEINKMYDIGDIRNSLLPEAQFQSRNGACWVLMNGQSVVGSLYASLTGRSNLPAAAGRFLRNAGGAAAALAETQEDEFASHTHIQNAHNHIQGFAGVNATSSYGVTTAPAGNVNSQSGTNTNNHPLTSSTTAVNQNSGGGETRPRNLTVNMFVKINNCN